MMSDMLQDYLKESIEVANALLADSELPKKFASAVGAVEKAFAAGNKILVAGNGGSAADAQHFAAEFVGKYKMVRKALPAIALTTDTSTLTAWSNDVTFDEIFARQIEAIGKHGDIFFGITTSGNSKNLLKALTAAKQAGIFTIMMLGSGGGAAKGIADIEFIVPSSNTPRLQEMHTLILHGIAEEVEKRMSG